MGEGDKPGAPAIVLRGTGTIVGMYFSVVAHNATGFAGTVPIPGKIELVWVRFDTRGPADFDDFVRFQLAIANEIPASQGELDQADQLFPNATSRPGTESSLLYTLPYFTVPLPVGAILAMNGRRFVGGFYNPYATSSEAHAVLGIRGVLGGEARAGVSFLSGDWLEER